MIKKKKITNKLKALLICAIIIVSNFTVMMNVFALEGFDTFGSASYKKENDGTYTFETSADTAAVISDWKLEAVSGLELQIENFGKGWIMVSFAQNKSDLNGGFPTSATPTLLLADASGKLQAQYWNGSQALATTVTNFSSTEKHTVGFVRGGDSYYRFAIDGNLVCGAASFDENSIKSINNYNSQTEEFDGAYFQLFAEKSGAKISNIKQAVEAQSNEPFKKNGGAVYSDNVGSYSFSTSSGGAIISNWQLDATLGLEMNIGDFGKGWIMVSFAEKKSHLNGSYPSVSTPTLLLADMEGKLQAQYWNGSQALATTLTELPATGKHTIYLEKQGSIYRFCIDETTVCFAASFGTDTVDKINNYNSQTQSSAGAYFQIFAEKAGVSISNIKAKTKADTSGDFIGKKFSFEKDENGAYDISIDAEGVAKSTWQADITKGLDFNLNSLPSGWLMFTLCTDYNNLANGGFGEDASDKISFLLRNNNGKLGVSLFNNQTNQEIAGATYESLDALGNHTLYADKFESGGAEYYGFYIDGVRIIPAYSESAEKTEAINNYNSKTGEFDGAFFRFFAEMGGIKILNIKQSEKPVKESKPFTGKGFEATTVSKSVYNIAFNANNAYAKSTWQVDLIKGLAFDVREFGTKGIKLLLSDSYGNLTEDSATVVLNLKKSGDSLYVSLQNENKELFAEKMSELKANGSHILTVASKEDVYSLYIDDVQVVKGFNLTKAQIDKLNNFDETKNIYDGAYFSFVSPVTNTGIDNIYPNLTIIPTDRDFTGAGFNSNVDKYGDKEIHISKNKAYAVSTWKANFFAGLTFSIDDYRNGYVSLDIANDYWNISGTSLGNTQNGQYILVFENDNGKLKVSRLDGTEKKDTQTLSGVKACGKHVIVIKTVDGENNYGFFIDDIRIFADYKLSQSEGEALNNFDSTKINSSGAYFRFGSQYSGVNITSIYVLDYPVPSNELFTGIGISSQETDENGYYDLKLNGAAKSTWTFDLNKGLIFNLENVHTDWVSVRLGGNYYDIPDGSLGSGISGQVTLLLKKFGNGELFISVFDGSSEVGGEFVNTVKAEGSHILKVEGTGGIYKLFLDGKMIVPAYSIGEDDFKLMNGWNRRTGKYDGAYIRFGTYNGSADVTNMRVFTVGKETQKNDWISNTGAKAELNSKKDYKLSLNSYSSIKSQKQANLEKGIKMSLDSYISGSFGITFSMLQSSSTLDIPPAVKSGETYTVEFCENATNEWEIIDSEGNSAIYKGDLFKSHKLSFKSVTVDGEKQYVFSIDDTPVFEKGIDLFLFVKMNNGGFGAFPTVFAKSDVVFKSFAGDFVKIASSDEELSWDDDWEPETDLPAEEKVTDDSNTDISEELEEEVSESDDEYLPEESDGQDTEEQAYKTVTKTILKNRRPLVKWFTDWGLIWIGIAVAVLGVGTTVLLLLIKRKKNKSIK